MAVNSAVVGFCCASGTVAAVASPAVLATPPVGSAPGCAWPDWMVITLVEPELPEQAANASATNVKAPTTHCRPRWPPIRPIPPNTQRHASHETPMSPVGLLIAPG